MTVLVHIARMLRYTAWADARVLEALRAAPLDESSRAEPLKLFAHVLAAERVWLARLERQEVPLPPWPQLSLDQCAELAAKNASDYAALVAALTDDQLGNPVPYHSFRGDPFQTPIVDILLQVITHGPYHRGQIAKTLGRDGATVPNTDYITFVREVGE